MTSNTTSDKTFNVEVSKEGVLQVDGKDVGDMNQLGKDWLFGMAVRAIKLSLNSRLNTKDKEDVEKLLPTIWKQYLSGELVSRSSLTDEQSRVRSINTNILRFCAMDGEHDVTTVEGIKDTQEKYNALAAQIYSYCIANQEEPGLIAMISNLPVLVSANKWEDLKTSTMNAAMRHIIPLARQDANILTKSDKEFTKQYKDFLSKPKVKSTKTHAPMPVIEL